MDEQKIMIDNVDVNECDYYKNNGKCRIPHYQQNIKYTCCNCSEWNCYYKQLQRERQNSQEARDAAIKEFNRAKELSQVLTDIKEYCTNIKKDHYWGMRIIRFAEQILQKINEVNKWN